MYQMDNYSSTEAVSESSRKIFDRAEMLDRLEDCAFVRRLLEVSLDELPALFKELQRLCRGNDYRSIWTQAHRLKGFALNISAHDLCDTALQVEAATKNGVVESIRVLLPDVEQQIVVLLNAIRLSLSGDPDPTAGNEPGWPVSTLSDSNSEPDNCVKRPSL
jgi:HPt (histidine-containing phosphotransfer) domain-containing protein